jgi:hypothetical protein
MMRSNGGGNQKKLGIDKKSDDGTQNLKIYVTNSFK